MYVSSGSVLEMGKEKCVRDQTWRSRSSNGTTRRPSYLSERHAPRAGHHPGFLGLLLLELLGLGDAMTSLPLRDVRDEIRIKSDFLVYFDDAF